MNPDPPSCLQKENGSCEMGVIIYGSFLVTNFATMEEGVVRQHELGNICRSRLRGGGVCAPTPIEAYVEAEGGIGICVDPPVTVVLDTGDFRVAVMGWYYGYGSTFCKIIDAHQINCNKEICRCH